jgi:hypothetical protein
VGTPKLVVSDTQSCDPLEDELETEHGSASRRGDLPLLSAGTCRVPVLEICADRCKLKWQS